MKIPFQCWFVTCALALSVSVACAENADRDKPMNVEADALRYDDNKQVSTFTGQVVLTKGTILIRGDKLEVRQDSQGYQYGVVTGVPGQRAFFKQKREGVDEIIEGEGETIDYDGRLDTVKFTGQAQLRRFQGAKLNDEFNAGIIVYNNLTNVFTLDGAPAAGSTGSTGQPGAPAGRVRAMLAPKSAPASAPASSAPLRSSPKLGGSAQ
ncbi:lipopolysaccharide transport periplasmic protein LptA [Rhodoferax sp.]|uniref:lipopolysaccharide transport periplasmic protein LptA n=1 Tax=Rhodoferax sp. TaxID=50421 RepID=UPI00262D5B22|nr:lipopolysaccharide transport periplasmic protein LptA [Rhodoferax sp.]MDD2918946.1 lipopolysaccharide transport periplasmic protein LptA [Rhodoferax sp.]